MGLAAFQRMRLRQVEKMKPENIKKEQEVKPVEKVEDNQKVKPIIEETLKEEVVENTEEVKETKETTTRRKSKANN